MEISRQTFQDPNTSDLTRLLMLFDVIEGISKKVDAFPVGCNNRFSECQKQMAKINRVNKYWSGTGGLIGGMIAFVGSKLFGQ